MWSCLHREARPPGRSLAGQIPSDPATQNDGGYFVPKLPETPTLTPTKSAHDNSRTLLAEIEAQRVLMISVATGGPKIQSVDRLYKERRANITDADGPLCLGHFRTYRPIGARHGRWLSGVTTS